MVNKQNKSLKNTFLEPKQKKSKRSLFRDDEILLNNEKINLYKNIEYNSWLRSHGGNWNTHFHNDNFINVNNAKKLKWIWKHSNQLLKMYIKKINGNKILKLIQYILMVFYFTFHQIGSYMH